MRYAHTNIVAKDWKALAAFYQEVFGCVPVPPERDLSGPWLDGLTGLSGAHIRGAHLLLPGHGDQGPTLEIFEYDAMPQRPQAGINTPGLAHLAFEFESRAEVEAATKACLERGGRALGKQIVQTYADGRTLTAIYVTDPEGNILELQSWEDAA